MEQKRLAFEFRRGLKDEDIELVADGLRRCTATVGPSRVDLRHNQFGDIGVQHLVLALLDALHHG